MTSVGFRCSANEFTYVVLDGSVESPRLVHAERRRAPAGDHDRPTIIRWFHDDVHEVLDAHRPDEAFFKDTEGNSQTKNLERAQLEGVLMEAGLCHKQRLTIARQKEEPDPP